MKPDAEKELNPDFQILKVSLRELQPLLRKKLGDELIVDSFSTKPLVQPGENYGSTILSVDAVIRRTSDSEKEDLFLIAKMPPPTEFQRRMFDSPFTFQKEIFMYEGIIPAYNQLEIEEGVPKDQVFDVLPKYYGSRMSLDPNVKFDDDAVILLENLKNHGYYVNNRSLGCDYEHSKVAIRAMARFHALGMSMKYKKPEQFEILKKRSECLKFQGQDFNGLHVQLLRHIKDDELLKPHYERCEKILNVTPEEFAKTWQKMPEEPWATIIHADFWVNNIMFHRDNDGKVDNIKFVDFQNYLFLSPLREMIFYLFVSADNNVLDDHVDELVDLYYETLTGTLTKMGCDTEPFNREGFDNSIPAAANIEFLHICLMLKVVTLDAKEVRFDETNIKDLLISYTGNSLYTEKLRRVVWYFTERNWI